MTDSTAIARADASRELANARNDSANVIAMVLDAARDPNIDASKVKTMADLAMVMQDREQKQQFNRDLNSALMKMPRISKRGRIIIPGKNGGASREQGKFAHFEDIDAAVRPILAEHNLTIRFKLGGSGQRITATPIIAHANGYVDEGEALEVPPDTSGSKNAAQAVGSASSYAKRYAMCAALNIITEGEDRDGTTYPLEDDPLNDRQLRLIAEADASHNDGNFAEWWNKQTAQDRSWLIIKGVYARLTGAPALGDALQSQGEPEPERQEDDVTRSESQPEVTGKRTPEQMVDAYLEKLEATTTREAMQDFQIASEKFLAGIRDRHSALNDKINERSQRHYAKLYQPNHVGDPNPPSDDDVVFDDDGQADLLGGGND